LAVTYLCLFIPLNLMALYASAILQGMRFFSAVNIIRLCMPASYAIGLVFITMVDWWSVTSVLVVNLISNLLVMILAGVLVFRLTKRAKNIGGYFNIAVLLRDIRYGILAHVGSVQPFKGLQVDILILTLLFSAHDLGLYLAAWAGAAIITAQGTALGMVLLPELAKSNSLTLSRKIVFYFGGLTLFLSASTAIIATFFADPLIRLVYGNNFIGAIFTLKLLVLSSIVGSFGRVLADALRGLGKPFISTKAELLSLFVGAIAILIIAPTGGPAGAAIAVGLASISSLMIVLPALVRTLAPLGY